MCSNKYFGWSSIINLWKNQCMSEYKHAQKIVAIRETCILFIFFIVFSFCQITLSCPIFYPPNHINYEIELFSNMDTLYYNSSFLYVLLLRLLIRILLSNTLLKNNPYRLNLIERSLISFQVNSSNSEDSL